LAKEKASADPAGDSATGGAIRRKRRTQAERSDAMRERLLEATLECLRTDGYAGTSVSKIVQKAGVSRGAHVHHYPSKTALLADAAEHLMRLTYRRLGHVLLGTARSENRLDGFLHHAWTDLAATAINEIYVELLIASRRDEALAEILRTLGGVANKALSAAADHYFEPVDPAVASARDLTILNHWMLRGMALDIVLAGGTERFEDYLKIWGRVLATHLKAREGILAPPPRPADWDRHWDDVMAAQRRRADQRS
jgi:AcrR family transcriptional regulator